MKKTVYFPLIMFVAAACSKPVNTADEQVIQVKTAQVQLVKNGGLLEYSGTVEASQTIPLNFQTNGTVEKIMVDIGDPVKKGQLLASIDKTDLQSIYNTALTRYNQAKDAYNRLKEVYTKGSLPEIKWIEIQSDYSQAKYALDLAANNLDKCNLYAPSDGIVGKRNLEPGQSALGIVPAPIELIRIETVFIKISVPENEISAISKGMKGIIRLSALNDSSYSGTVSHISPVADPFSRTFTVKIQLSNKDSRLKPGMVCNVSLPVPGTHTILLTPINSVNCDHSGKTYVYLVARDKKSVVRQYITTGKYAEEGIEVISGLEAGQTVVTQGCEKLSDHALISF